MPCSHASSSILYRNEDDDRNEGLMLHAPVDVSPDGVASFLRHVFNHKDYIEVLPHNMNHLMQLLQNAKDTHQTRAYAKSVIKLFSNKLKAVSYINAYTFSQILGQLPETLSIHFVYKRPDTFDSYKEMINNILYETFLSKYESFKKDPTEFFGSLSHEILDTLQQDLPDTQEDISTDDLRQTLIRFLEISLNKLIWHPDEHEKIWENVKIISHQLKTLMEHNILNDTNDIDDLYWSLIHRFCYFLQIAGPQLSVEFYETIKNDLANQQLLLLELEEQEELIETKRDCLTLAILEGQARKQAIDMGVIVS